MAIQPRAKSLLFSKLHTSVRSPSKVVVVHEKGIFVPWTTNCLLCKAPETIEHVFIFCWDALLFWDVLQRTLKKDLKITAHSIRFLPITSQELVPYDLITLIGLYSIWCSRMAVRHADLNPRPVETYFLEFVTEIRSTYAHQDSVPEWVGMCERLLKSPQRIN
uniref:Reverse transcriptase zinc-binding domain-containing protein n=1 Tax=Ixodes ricinus TaxID=34613 RepID=V5HSY1_IXORI